MNSGDVGANNIANQVAETQASLDPTTTCPVYSETGKCKYGFKCRFLGAHVKTAENGLSDELSLVIDGETAAHGAISATELNFVDPSARKQLRTRKVTTFHSSRVRTRLTICNLGLCVFHPAHPQYPRPISDAYLKEIQQSSDTKDEETLEPSEETEVDLTETSRAGFEASTPSISPQDVDTSQTDTPDTPIRFAEKKRLHWNGKTCTWFHSVERTGSPYTFCFTGRG